jgi:hypothetical protein
MSSTITAPLPRFIAPGHFQIDSSTHTLVAYDLRFDHEHEAWTCNCQGYSYRYNCKHVTALAAQLEGTRPEVVQARQAVKARGITLESLFPSYDSPPTHQVTNRSRVAAPR